MMNCHETETWLLSDETPNRPTAEVRVHLRSCTACHQRFARLVRLIHEVRNAPLQAVPAAGRAKLFAQIEPAPTAIPVTIPMAIPLFAPVRPSRARRWSNAPWLRLAAAAMLCIGLGLVIYFVARPGPQDPILIVEEEDDDREDVDGPVEDRVLARHLVLAETLEPVKQLRALNRMAADVRTESLATAGKGTSDDLALLAWLHARLLHDGILRTARAMDGDNKALVLSIVKELRKAETELEDLVKDVPKQAANPLRQMRLQAHDAAAALEGGPDVAAPAAQPPVIVGSRALLQTLVVSSLQVANEEDPIKRAGHSTDVAGRLADVLAEQGDKAAPDRVNSLTKALEKVMMRGVHGNLAQLDLAKTDDASRKHMEQIHKQAEASFRKLQPSMLKISQEARQHLTRFQELTKQIKTQQFNKGKGLPWKKPARGGKPR
jgi:anti-sigma factor RsiW